jgi:small subunit ribosomal protein S5
MTDEVKNTNTAAPVATGDKKPFAPRPATSGGFPPRRPFGQPFNGGAPRPFGSRPSFGGGRPGAPTDGGARGFSKNPRKFGKDARPKPEYDQKILNMRRVTRVSAGGKRFNFSVALVAGDRKGKVGVGLGKANDTSLAIDKALRNAKKNMVVINTTSTMSIPHEVSSKYCSAMVVLRPAKERGIVAGSAMRNVIELAGIKDVTAKILSGSKNKLNIARATVEALQKLPKVHAKKVEIKKEAAPVKVEEVKPKISKEIKK